MLIQDARTAFLSRRDPARTEEISDLMYANDTLILEVNNEHAEIYMFCIEQAGRMYGWQLNWNKMEELPMRCEAQIKKSNGELFFFPPTFLLAQGLVGAVLLVRF